MAYTKIVDNYGRIPFPLVGNESEDGTGTWHQLVSDSNGFIKVSLQAIADDVGLPFGTGSPAKIQWQTNDANANALGVILPEGGAVDVPVFFVGDTSAEKDLGFWNGVTSPMIAAVSPTASQWMGMFHDGSNAYLQFSTGRLFLRAGSVSEYVATDNANSLANLYGVGGYLRIGDAATTSRSLNAEDDLMVTGELEVDGDAFFDSKIAIAGTNDVSFLSVTAAARNYSFRITSGSDLDFRDDSANSSRMLLQDNGTLLLNYPLFMLERAAKLASVPGQAELWVKNTTPCQLWYTDDAGTDTQIV